MEYVRLGNSELNVSRICLGTVFRSEMDERTCIEAIHAAADEGCNFIDCANIYRDGFSEQIVGQAVRGRRDQFVISTKVGTAETNIPDSGGLSRREIMRSVEQSLSRLDTDYLDSYLCHFPDPNTSHDETFAALDQLVRQGKVRWVGVSRYESWRLCEVLATCRQESFATPICNQLSYGLLDRRIEDEMVSYCQQHGIAITVFASTSIGLLSGRYRYGQPPPPGTSWYRGPYNYRIAMTRQVDEVIQAVVDIAAEQNKTPTQITMAWCLAQPGITSVITGADTPDRVRENCQAANHNFSPEDLERMNRVSEGQRLVIRKDCPEGFEPSNAD